MPNDPDADLRTAYQTAATLYMQENTVTWARFNIMLFANSIIIAAAGLTAANRLYVTALVLPVAGCLVCLL